MTDAHDLFRTGLVSLLEGQLGIAVVGQCSRSRGGVQLTEELAPDVVVIGLGMSGLTDWEAMPAMRARRPELGVVILAPDALVGEVAAVLAGGGAFAFLAKDAPVERITAAIHAASEGAVYLSPPAAQVILGRYRSTSPATADAAPPPPADLSPREREVLSLMACGTANSEIAEILYLSPHTVKNHVSNILHKLGARNRLDAAIRAMRLGLTSDTDTPPTSPSTHHRATPASKEEGVPETV